MLQIGNLEEGDTIHTIREYTQYIQYTQYTQFLVSEWLMMSTKINVNPEDDIE